MVTTTKKTALSRSQLSIVIPVFNEEKSVPLLCQALNDISSKLPKTTEIILVNDGSSDATTVTIKKAPWKLPVKIIELSRNFGHQAALLAGLEAAKGEMVVSLDGDLQHPITLIPELCVLGEQGYDIVLTQRVDRTATTALHKRLTSKFFYSLLNVLSQTTIPVNTSDFRLIKRQALNQLLAMPEHSKFLRGLVNWIGFKSIIVPFQVNPRVAGNSKYSFAKMCKLAFQGLTSFSAVPLYFSGIFSFGLFALALLYALYVLYIKFFGQEVIEGWASVLFVLLVLGGFITLFLGLIGSYLAAIFEEVKQRPPYIKKTEYQV